MKSENSLPYLIGIAIQVICGIWILSLYSDPWGTLGIVVFGPILSVISLFYFGLVFAHNPIKKLFIVALSIIGFIMLNVLFALFW